MVESLVKVGGKSCRQCKYWSRYNAAQVETLKLASMEWGRCMNEENLSKYRTDSQSFSETYKDRSNVVVEPLSEDFLILSTYENYNCSNYKGKSK